MSWSLFVFISLGLIGILKFVGKYYVCGRTVFRYGSVKAGKAFCTELFLTTRSENFTDQREIIVVC